MQDRTYANPTRQTASPWAMAAQDRERRVLSVAEVARYCGLADVEVLTWIDSGKLRASPVGVGRYRIAVGDLLAFLGKFRFEM